VLQENGELWRAAPFSAVPTAFPLKIGNRSYYGNCIWDALGIPAMLAQNARIDASCGCCNLEMLLKVKNGRLQGSKGWIHIAVPARDWYKDIVFLLLFRSEQHVDRWCEQWNRPRGGILDLQQGWRLAKEWYGDRLSPAGRPKSASEAQAAFARIGLKGEFWKLSV